MCSPLKRCLETARITLDTIEMKKRGVSLIVRGDCREILSSQCSFPVKIKESIQEFYEFEFSHIMESLKKYGPFFVADYLENKPAKEKLISASKTLSINSDKKEIAHTFINLLKEGFLTGNELESNVNLFSRVKKTKAYLKEFVNKNNVKDGELVVVAHSRFAKAFTAKSVNVKTDEFVEEYKMKNYEILELEI